jgi:aspartate/methionine/tyrosine aminotransferase
MSFDRNDYLHWYLPRMRSKDNPINLHASGVSALGVDEIEAATGDQWTMVARFEQGLASRLGVPSDEICFAPGATGGTLLALLTFAGSGDELVVESPIYEPMLRQAERLNRVKRFSRRPERDWRIPLAEVEEEITDGTAIVMITEPSNPGGTFCDRSDVLSLAEAASARGAIVLVNEVYRCFSDRPSFHGEMDNIVVVSSFSKLLGTYGLRLGWLSGSPDLIKKAKSAHMNLGMANQPAAAYGLGVLARADELRRRSVEISASGVDTVDRWVRSTKGVDWTRPMGPGFGCVRLPANVRDDIEFAERLMNKFGVLVIPGTHFEVPGTVRLSWLQSGDRLEEGLSLFARALEG